MPTQTTVPSTSTSLPPILQPGPLVVGTASGMTITLNFNTQMAAGAGTIIVTDGAVQTVIDRATGLPTLRVVGATDTHTISASSLDLHGNEVALKVAGLLADHRYSVVMGADALQSADHVAFGGVRSTSQVSFRTPDTQAPALVGVAADGGLLKAGGSFVVTLTFSEAVANLPADALSARYASIANVTKIDGGVTWQVTLAAPANATTAAADALSLDMSKVLDAAGNHGNGATTLASYAVDTAPPTATVTLDNTVLGGGHDAVATIRFSEAVTGLAPAALSAGHATVADLRTTDGGVTWVATLSGNAATSAVGNVLAVDLGQVRDLAGNAGSGSVASPDYIVDTQGPNDVAIVLDGATLGGGQAIHATFTFAERVQDPTAAISAPHAHVSGLATSDGGKTWTATLTADGSGAWTGNTVGVDLALVKDLAGNAGSGTFSSAAYVVDTQGPATVAIALDGTALGGANAIHATFTFAEPVRDLPAAAISAPHAHVSSVATSDGGKTWTATLTADGSGAWSGNTIGVDLAQVKDLAGNAGSGVFASAAYAVDTQGPGATLAVEGAAVTIHFTEAVTDLTTAALQSPNATFANLQHSPDWLTWTATVVPQDGGGHAVGLDLTQVHDAFGNAGSGSVTAEPSGPTDTTPPTVADILFDGATIDATHGIHFTITFSESVSGLTSAALQAPHAKISDLATTDGGRTWTGTLMAEDGAGASTGNQLRVDLTQVHDAAGNAGTGSATSLSHYDVGTAVLTATVDLDGGALVSGAGVGVTVSFSAPVDTLDASAFTTPHATLTNLHHSDDYRTWYGTLATSDAGVVAATNAVGLDLAHVHDRSGNAGAGTVSSGNYTYDTTVAAYVSQIFISDAGPYDDDGITNTGNEYVGGYFIGALTGSQHVKVTLDDQDIDAYSVHVDSPEGGLTYWYYGSEAYLAAGKHTFTASIVDDGGHASATATKTFTLDLTAPNLTGSPNGSTAFDVAGNVVLTFDKAVYWKDGESAYDGLRLFNEDGGSTTYIDLTAANFSDDHKTITLTADELHLGAGNHYSIGLPSALTDLAGNTVVYHPIDFLTAGTYVDVTAPRATGARASVDGDHYGIGETIEIRVSFSEPVNVAGAGTPVLHLNNGAAASFEGLSDDHRTAIFDYTVAAGDQDVSGLDISSRADLAGHFADDAGNLLDLAHITFGYLTDASGYGGDIYIDGHAPDAPSAPQLAAASDTGTVGDNVTSVVAPTITGGGAEAGARIDLYVGDRLAGSGWADDAGHWTLDDVLLGGNGSYTLKAMQYDDADNASALSQPLTITVAGATAAMTALAAGEDTGLSTTDSITMKAAPVLTGSVAAGTQVTVWDGSTKLGSTTADSDGAWHFQPLWDLANGQHTITLELKDASGNVTPREVSIPFTFIVDFLEPNNPGRPVLDASSDTGVSNSDGITMDTTPTITGTAAENGGWVEIYENGVVLGHAIVEADRSWSFTFPADQALADGVHTFATCQVDVAGNRSAPSAPLTITVDTTAPTITASQPATKAGSNWYDLTFSEQVVFAQGGSITVLDSGNVGRAHHAWDVLTNWDIAAGNTLELNLGTLSGTYHLAVDGSAIQDVAGNVAIIGATPFDVGPTA